MATGNYVEVEADRRAAENSGCAVTLKSNPSSPSDHCEVQSEAPKLAEEDITRRRGQSQGWGRGRPRASRFRQGHYSQGSMRDNPITESESLEDKDSERRLSPSNDGHEKHFPSGDWDTGPPSYSSASQPSESALRPSNGGQKSRESSRGQRAMSSRGHSRGSFAKFVTVPDALHSHDVRHVEEVNNSIVINIDRSTRLIGDSTRRGGRSTGGGSGNPTGELLEDSAKVRDQEPGVLSYSDNTQHQKSGYQGQGRRPFRGRGESSFRGEGRGRGDKFRRGRGDGPRPFRGGYRADRARGGRTANTSRQAVIVTSKSERGDSSQQVPESEEWDKIVPAADAPIEAVGTDCHGWTNTEDGSANWDEGGVNQEPDRSELIESGHLYKASHKESDLHEGEEVADQNEPEEHDCHVVEQSESHSVGIGGRPKTSLGGNDESISTQAEHSLSCVKSCETSSALPVDAIKGGVGINAVDKLTTKPGVTSSALPVDTTKGGVGINAVDKLTEKPGESSSALPVDATKGGLGIIAVDKLTTKPGKSSSALPVDATKGGLGINAVDKLTEKPGKSSSALPVDATKGGVGINAVDKLTEKPGKSSSALPVDATKGGVGINAVDKLTTKPGVTSSALPVDATKGGVGILAGEKLKENSSSNTETNTDSKPHKLNTVYKAVEVENPSLSYYNRSHELVPEKVSEAANEVSNAAVKPCNVGVVGLVDMSSSKTDSLLLVPEKAVCADLKQSDPEKSSSEPVPSVSAAAAAQLTAASIQPEAPAVVLLGESIPAEPRSPDSGLVDKSEVVISEIPASVEENT